MGGQGTRASAPRTAHRRTAHRLRAAALSSLTVAFLLGSGSASAAGPVPGKSASTPYYLALGDSVPVWDGRHSYAHLLEDHYLATLPGLALSDMAVSEETTTSMLDGGQYQSALRFLHKHAGHVALITIDIGGNDIVHCATPTGIDATCVTNGLATIETNLATMLSGLRAAAPTVPVIGMTYYNPYLGDWLAGGPARALAIGSLTVVAQLNTELLAVYGGTATTADVEGAFRTQNLTPLVRSAWGRVPVDVDRSCSWLWIVCHVGRTEGFADDPNTAGQDRIAAAFERTIGKLRAP